MPHRQTETVFYCTSAVEYLLSICPFGRSNQMQRLCSCFFVSTLVLTLLLGCQPSVTTAPSPSTGNPQNPAEASGTAGATKTKLAVVTEIYDSNGAHLNQQFDIVEASPSIVTERFRALDFKHPTNRYGIVLSSGSPNSRDRRKLSIIEDLPDGATETVLTARLEETPPGSESDKYYNVDSIESPEVALKLLLSFLAEDGEYRKMVPWVE